MNSPRPLLRQDGATLIVGLIMLAVITLLVTSAFSLSTTNIKSVGNMQFRDEAVAAANHAIEQVISSAFAISPAGEEINVDLNNDGVTDYVVDINTPSCLGAAQMSTASGGAEMASSVTLGLPIAPNIYSTMWNIDATVTDAASGTSVRVHQGVRVLLNETQFNSSCAPAAAA